LCVCDCYYYFRIWSVKKKIKKKEKNMWGGLRSYLFFSIFLTQI